jgi:AcrR family transcriptional regulator
MAATRTPRERWVEAGLTALAGGGPDAVRVEALARTLGVTKGGFYWHFADRPALLEAMLDAWELHLVDEVIDNVESRPGDSRERLRRLLALAASADELRRVDLAVRIWAREDAAVAVRLDRVDGRRVTYLREIFAGICDDPADVEARCLVVMSLFVAGPFLAVTHGRQTRASVMGRIEDWLEA